MKTFLKKINWTWPRPCLRGDLLRPIKPDDLLTTLDVPGHVMKVTDHTRAKGAVVGKAMSSLKDGKGTVLMLVSLQ